ncbi:MAG: response regulator transcription factor [Bacteroidetes bacterium]|nr:response regulator transcription factor [Bacteroidota bacterium]MCL1969672.1 response regulator transcription factor [Bacteroidota bacterium]
MRTKILIVDDDELIREVLEFNLVNEGFEITCAASGEEAMKKLSSEHALILLDIMMGGMSGYRFAEELRKKGNDIPIIFLTAKDTENDMLTGFSVGGDDYISKPFSIKEVIVRIKAILKRQNKPEDKPEKMIFNDLTIDLNTKEMYIKSKKIELTKTEYNLLIYLIQKSDRVISREEIIDTVWKETPFITERTVDVHIARLRKKLENYSHLITNKTGFGYRFDRSEL